MPTGTTKRNKCNSKPFWFNPKSGQTIPAGVQLTTEQKKGFEYFDSVLEFKIYGKLVKKYGSTFITRQLEIPLLYGNDTFPPLTWKVDFSVLTTEGLLLFEGKGEWILSDKYALSDFRKTLRLLQINQPDHFKNLKLIGDENWRLPGTQLFVTPFKDL